jgi:hypothetical protein
VSSTARVGVRVRTARLARAVVACNLALLAFAVGVGAVIGWDGGSEHWVIAPVWLVVGSMLVLRRPDNAIGWVLSIGVLCWLASAAFGRYAVYGFWHAEGGLPGMHLAFWLSTWTWVPGFTLVLPLAALWFPDGRPPSPRWRPVGWAAMLGTTLLIVQYTMISWVDNGEFPALPAGVENPLHSPAFAPFLETFVIAGGVLVVPALVASLASLVVRFRRSKGVERQQLKWATHAVAVGVVLFLSGNLLTRLPLISWAVVSAVAASLFPIAIAVAVLRYRLYDIDRIIRRTVTYATVTLLLIGLYAAGVVGLGAVLRGIAGGSGGDLVVAASTLLVAAAFSPLRQRVQAVVDRRFNRARYDAQRTVEAFAQRLRDEVDLAVLRGDLIEVVGETIHPRSVGLWTPALDEVGTP